MATQLRVGLQLMAAIVLSLPPSASTGSESPVENAQEDGKRAETLSNGAPKQVAAGLSEQPPAAPNQGEQRSGVPDPWRVVTHSTKGLGTRLRILVYTDAEEASTKQAISAALAEMTRVNKLMSERETTSEVAQLNRAAGKAMVQVSAETLFVLQRGRQLSILSSGAFALTWAALAPLWDFSPGQAAPRIPDVPALQRRILLVDDSKLTVDLENRTARLAEEGMAVGVRGIVKGFSADRAAAVLHTWGFDNVLIYAGGDLVAKGAKGDTPWLIGIQDPGAAGYFATLPVRDEAVATSGNYEHFFELEGKRYHHILDPATGMPARGCRSVTAIAKDALTADAMATAIFVLGPQRGIALVEEQEDLEAILVDEENNVVVSTGLRERARVLRTPTI